MLGMPYLCQSRISGVFWGDLIDKIFFNQVKLNCS